MTKPGLWRAVVSVTALLAWLTPARAFAQATGSVAGTVTDVSGGVLPGVTVEVTNAATNQSRTVVTGSDGYYTVLLLQPGQYDVNASLSGFKTVVRKGMVVTVTETTRVDLKLPIGGVSESVTVSAAAPLVDTSHSELGVTVNQQQVVDLPLNGRNFTQLGTLIPGVVASPASLGGASGDATPGGFGATTAGFSVNGMRNQSNNFLLDGAVNNDTFNTGFVLRPPPDAIQEFKIQTHSYSAEYGRNAGSVVNVVTKSGSNVVHGDAWEFNRNSSLQARNFFASADEPKPSLQQNQFGGTLGGPLIRNRLFGFGYYEGFRNTHGITSNVLVPTLAERNGGFGGKTIVDPLTGQPFPNNTIPADRLSGSALKLLDQFVPDPNTGANRYIISPDALDHRDSYGLRFDYKLTQNQSLFGRYMQTNTHSLTPTVTQAIGTTSTSTLRDYMASDTYIFSEHAINVARVSYNEINARPTITSGLNNSDYGINVPNTNPLAQGLANITINGYFSLGDSQQPFVKRQNSVFELSDDFTWTLGTHALKFGFDVHREHMYIAFINRPNGDFTFNGVQTGDPLADFLLGTPSQFRRTTTNQAQDGLGYYYAGYAQDDWRASSRVTVNAGVRYEVSVPFVDTHDALNAFHPGQQSIIYPDAPAGLVYPGDPGVPRGTYATDKNNVAPRLGLVWDPTGSGRTTVSGAWGIFYDAVAGQGDFFQNGVLAPPFTPLVEVDSPPAPLTLGNPLNAISGGPTLFPPGLIVIGMGEHFQTAYAYQYNVTVQHQFGNNIGAEIGYVGSKGEHLPIFMEVNPGLYSPGQTTPDGRLFPAFSLVRPTFSVAQSEYNSLQASVRLRPTHGIRFLVSYTLGHAMDDVSGLNIGGEPRPVLPVTIGDQASIDRALSYEWGDALFDVRQRFVMSFGVDLPTPHHLGAIAEHTLGGWSVNGIIQKQTGFPESVTDSTTTIRYLTNRPDAICDPNANAPHTIDEWFDTSCFVRRSGPETAERPGNAGRNTIRGPGFAETDIALYKSIGVGHGQHMELRFETYDLFNQIHFNQPSGVIGTADFGKITSAQDGRIIQLGIKFLF